MRTLVSGVDMLLAGVLYIFTNNNCEDGYRVCLQKIDSVKRGAETTGKYELQTFLEEKYFCKL